MYLVKFKSSGVIAYRSLDRTQAMLWALQNDIEGIDGNPAGLFIVVKAPKQPQQAQEGA
jgi:hypothetical protein